MENTNTKKPFFYGWVIVAACMLIQAVPYGVATNVQPQFINFVTNGEGFTLTQFSLLFTIGTIVSALASPYIGKVLSDPKTNIKLVYIIGSILCGGGFALFSFAGGNLWAYYAISALVQVGTSIVSAIGVPLLLNSWFKENKGLAMGLAFCGSGIGNIFLQQVAARLLSNPNYGYAKAYLIFGIISLVVSVLISIFMVRLPKGPEELAANIPRKKEKDNNPKTSITKWGYALKEVNQMKLFWVLAVGFIFVGFYVSGMSVQYTSYLYKLGFSATYVANIGSIFAFFSILGNLCGGLFFDKLGIKKTLLLSGVMVILCGICLIFIPSIPALGYLFAILLGITIFAYIIGPSYLTGALFGDREFGTILGIVQIFFAAGFGIGSTLFGIITDIAGFNVGWISTLIYTILAYGGLIISTNAIIKHNKKITTIESKKIA